MAADHGLTLAHKLNGAVAKNIVGLRCYCILTGSNETPPIADLNLLLISLNLNRRITANQSNISLSLANASQAENLDAQLINQSGDIITELNNRLNGDLLLDIDLIDNAGIAYNFLNLEFNYDDFDYSAGAESFTVSVNGSKYLDSAGSGNMRVPPIITEKNYLDATTVQYRSPIIECLQYYPGDYITDNGITGLIKTISYSINRNNTLATLEVFL